ncbi:hypothetical protein N6H14_30590 [Paenibacillus sp. CC-CFT747]|nr:hypothetical protein N6H14_30590 [Paenibacillus sp. CC-CFT747]
MVKARMMLFPCLLFLLLVTSGCMYSEEKNKQNQLATGEFITVVQNAVDEFHKRRGFCPSKPKRRTPPL